MSEDLAVVRNRSLGFPDERERPRVESVLHGALRVVRRRRLVAVAVLVAFVVPAGLVVMRRPPIYEATARLLIERSDELTSVLRDSTNGQPPVDNFFQTQQQLLRSRPIVVKVIQGLKLWESPQFKTPLRATPTDEEISRSGLIDQFLLHLTVSPVAGTHLVNVTFEASDPDVAMHAVNTLTTTYKSEQVASQGQDSSNLMGWINDRLAEQQRRLKSSEAALQAYMASRDAVSVESRQNIVVQKLSDLNTALTRAKTERMTKEALYRQLQSVQDNQSALDSLPLVLSNSVLQQLRSQLAELKQKELGMSQELGDRHPGLIKLRSEIELTTKRLGAELAKLTESVKNDFVAAEAVERDLTSALDAQKREVVGLNQKTLDYGALQRQATSDRQIYERLLTESQTRGIAGKTAERTIRVVESAERPLAPVGPENRRDFLLVIAAGLFLAIGAPLTLEALDHRIKTPGDIEQHLHLPCLAMVPQLPMQAGQKRPVMTTEATGYNEAFRRIRAAISTVAKPQKASRLLVTSAAPNEGKSLVAVNLAIAFARAGQRVLLVDGDLRRPTVHTNFDLEAAPGFSNLLQRDNGAPNPIRGTSVPNLFVLTSGIEHCDAAELLSSPNLQALLSALETRFSWIVFDSPPVGPVADACIIARLVPQTLFVVAADRTTAAAASAAIDQLKATGARISGVILNRADLEKSAYYYYPYHQTQYAAYYASGADGRTS
jgi:succinoglycan biosynthesis transport protein ExoP